MEKKIVSASIEKEVYDWIAAKAETVKKKKSRIISEILKKVMETEYMEKSSGEIHAAEPLTI